MVTYYLFSPIPTNVVTLCRGLSKRCKGLKETNDEYRPFKFTGQIIFLDQLNFLREIAGLQIHLQNGIVMKQSKTRKSKKNRRSEILRTS